ncbi:MAG: peroxiredoxin-like family protein [Crocinitomicaceae bacterium]
MGQLYAQDQMFDVCPLKVGEEVPQNETLVNADGDSSTVSEVLSEKTILVFYRGGWCPYCMRHLSALHQVKEEMAELGYEIIAITPDQFDSLGVSEARAETDITIYSDSDTDVIEAFGLGWRMDDEMHDKYVNKYELDLGEWAGDDHHVLPVPAIYVVHDGVVQYQYVNPNYSVRLKPETLMAILKTL